ncbi:MAG: nicotinamide riboside transporter PnuC [Pseudomonadales bacterium]
MDVFLNYLPDALAAAFADMAWLEAVGLGSGLLCVWLLIRQNVWTFPIGLIYSFVSVAVFFEQRLYADVLLSGYYVLMNGYGWYYWLYGGRQHGAGSAAGQQTDELPVTRTPRQVLVLLGLGILAATLAMGWFFDNRTGAELPYWDSATTCMSFAAMWMTARKYLENWIVWLVVDVIATGIYLVKGIELYAVLYGVYLGMAVIGWRAWQQTLQQQQQQQACAPGV